MTQTLKNKTIKLNKDELLDKISSKEWQYKLSINRNDRDMQIDFGRELINLLKQLLALKYDEEFSEIPRVK